MADATDSITPVRNDKRERKHTAQILPPGITHHMMKKFVVYYRETMYLKNGKTQPREYFKVESHPRLKKPWVSSKSVKISLIEKLRIVKDTPGLITLALVYDRKDNSNGFRWTCSYTFSVIAVDISISLSNNNIEAQISLGIDKLREKLQEKYAVDLLSV